MADNQHENYSNLHADVRPVAEFIAGGASTLLFGALSVVNAIGAIIEQDISRVPHTGILGAAAYGGLRLAKKGYDTLCRPETYSPPAAG